MHLLLLNVHRNSYGMMGYGILQQIKHMVLGRIWTGKPVGKSGSEYSPLGLREHLLLIALITLFH